MILNKHDISDKALERMVLELNNGDRAFFDSLSQHEKDAILEILTELANSGESIALDQLWEKDFSRKPVDITTFLEDPYYLPRNDFRIYDRWKQDLAIALAPDSKYTEMILGGSIGCGKSSVACVALLYKLYVLSCMKNPKNFYDTGNTMVFAVFSSTLEQASSVGYRFFRKLIESSLYFQECFPRDNKYKEWIRMPNDIEACEGSRASHALGKDVFAALLDEQNFIQGNPDSKKSSSLNDLSKAYQIYMEIRRRNTSRFATKDKRAGLIILVSSASSKDSFLERHKEMYNNDPTVFIRNYALWDTKPDKFQTEKFYVDLGKDELTTPKIIATPEEALGEVLAVPMNVKSDFEKDIISSLRDLAGRAYFSVSPYMINRERLKDCIDVNREHPFTADTLIIDITNPSVSIDQYLKWDKVFFHDFDQVRPITNPGSPRIIHGDLAINGDAAGLACGHIAGWKEGQKFIPEKGQVVLVRDPIIHFDFILRITQSGGQIDISKIRDFIYYLARNGMGFAKITFDQFASHEMLQYLMKDGYPVDRLSVEGEQAYTTLMYAINSVRINMYRYDWFIKEITALQHDRVKKRIDHPHGGSKDVTDAVAGVVYNIMMLKDSIMLPPSLRNVEDHGELPVSEVRQMLHGYDSARKITSIENLDLDDAGF